MPVLSLREITDDNRAAVEALGVTEEQSHYVAGVTDSLAEALEFPDAKPWYRAVYADDEPVGFVMISDGITVDNPEYVGPYYLWRLLIDRRFQGRGYGRATLDAIAEYVRGRPGGDVLFTSCSAGDGSPQPFYLGYGFRRTDRVADGEDVLRLELRPDAIGGGR